jgi:nucleotide-binding universal stress UspA family protein
VFKHILFPTDGSPASLLAADACVRLATQIGARLTVIHVVPPIHLFTYEFEVTEKVHESYKRMRDQRAKEALDPVELLASAAKVPCKTMLVEADEPYQAILATANDQACDLVAMASHGHRGIRAVLLGSTTQKVLTHSALPVLVFR